MTPTPPLKVGIVGTGFAASRRAEAIQADPRSELQYVCGHRSDSIAQFCQTYGISSLDSWQALVTHADLDLIIIATINRDHARVARSALESGKHVIIEYPLALTPTAGQELIDIAQQQEKLLHVEHIELLGGLHQAQQKYLPAIGCPHFARYTTIVPQQPAPHRWTFHRDDFGFPLIAALSRIHRLTNLFGSVVSVSCQSRYWDASESGYFVACLSNARLLFKNGVIAQVTYGKGEVFGKSDRTFEIHGDQGSLIFAGETGNLFRHDQPTTPLEVGTRSGLFAKDTEMVLDHLFDRAPLYVTPQESLYALQVAHAASESSLSGETVFLE